MDCTFAIQISSNNDFEMLLIELRFNYISVRNLNRQKLLDKVSGSKNSLGNGTNISHRNIFVFNKALKEQAKNRLFRMLPKIPNNYEVMDIFELNNTFIK